MKPLEASVADCEFEMEYEMQTKDFFVHVGMLVMEGRIPELSEKGRVEGKHCPSLTGMVTHQCQHDKDECVEVLTRKQQMESLCCNNKCLLIDLIVQLGDDDSSLILMEQWTIEIVGSSSGHVTSCSMLMQAIRSHIHFSQLSAWLILSKGTEPKRITHRIRQPEASSQAFSFIREPVSHVFPLASLPGQSAVCVMVKSFPRCTISELMDELQWKLTELHVGENVYTAGCSNGGARTSPCKTQYARSPLRKKTCLDKYRSKTESRYHNDSEPSSSKARLFSVGPCSASRDKDSNGTASNSSNGIFNLGARLTNLETSLSRIDKNLDLKECENGVHLKKSSVNKKLESILSRCKEGQCTSGCTKDQGIAKTMLERKTRSFSEDGVLQCKDLRNKATGCNSNFTTTNHEHFKEPKQMLCHTKQSPTRRHGGAQNSSDVDIHAVRHLSLDRTKLRRSAELPIGACSEPVFNQKTGLPISSSPAPLRRSTNELDYDTTDFSNGLSNNIDYRELTKILSRSAPASTTQSLLGNFEESVLNGRMEPVGAVDGFTAELSASGSFCPPHVKLPINSYFYRLSDDDAPSPYMGFISLDEEPISWKGYHIPKRGTIQLTVFNPNKTVVKIFVVLYDFSDMTPQSQTFLRQKTFTVLKGHSLESEAQPSLNYLLHLRFASSKSGRIYLHTDIRVIFARQPPDLGTVYQLRTVTDGPTDPKYTPRHPVR